MFKVDSCCFCLSLTQGTVIIIVISFAISIIGLTYGSSQLSCLSDVIEGKNRTTFSGSSEEQSDENNKETSVVWAALMGIVAALLPKFLATFSLCYGTWKRIFLCVLLWLVIEVLVALSNGAMLLLVCVTAFQNHVEMAGIITLLVFIYYEGFVICEFIIVSSFLKELNDEEIEENPAPPVVEVGNDT